MLTGRRSRELSTVIETLLEYVAIGVTGSTAFLLIRKVAHREIDRAEKLELQNIDLSAEVYELPNPKLEDND